MTNTVSQVASMDKKNKRTPSSDPKNPLGYKFSSPIEELKKYHEVVVIGSGYGASVMAHRLSQKFSDLVVLERGREWHPGEFPETLVELGKSVKSSVNPLGLIDIASGTDVDIICASGLGGTSLINAAIAIRPEMNVFMQQEWPEEIQQAAVNGDLGRYFLRAESMLQPYRQPQRDFQKSKLHLQSARSAERQWGELNLNIRPSDYKNQSLNSFGYPQGACVQCGNCCTGCNYGAKNTLLTNYLFSAYKNGAKFFTQVEVQSLKRVKDIFHIELKIIPAFGVAQYKTLKAKYVFLGAGTKGSTEILLRSSSNHLAFSPALGTRLSANGDVMGMAYNGNSKTNIIGLSRSEMAGTSQKPGTIIASYANYRNPSLDGTVDSQFLLLDGVVPSSLAKTVAQSMAAYVSTQKSTFYKGNSSEEKQALERISADLNFSNINPDGALNHSMLYFACGHDSSGGRFKFNKHANTVDYVWKNVLEESTFKNINQTMKSYADGNGAVFIPNPRSTVFGGKKVQATHPLGGCPMGASHTSGVVNHRGEVFDSQGGIHKNLYVVDAAIIPRSLSATPLLTITALAERIADEFLKEK